MSGFEVVVLDVSVAITPETDGVEVLQVGPLLRLLQSIRQLGVRDVDAILIEEIGDF